MADIFRGTNMKVTTGGQQHLEQLSDPLNANAHTCKKKLVSGLRNNKCSLELQIACFELQIACFEPQAAYPCFVT